MDNVQLYEKSPMISQELTVWLSDKFPITTPAMDESEREIFFKAGQRSVVEHLTAIHKEQSDNILER